MTRTEPRGEPAHAIRAVPLLGVVSDLDRDLRDLPLVLELDGVEELRALRDRVGTQITNHLLPRLREHAMPAFVVVGGSTGAGKSTIVNSLVGEVVSEAGVLRPTTRKPVLIVHPEDRPLIEAHPVLTQTLVVESAETPRGLVLIDAPDLDSIQAENRALGEQLVETADLWLFVTTANRYGDALPWSVLQTAHARGVSLGVVLSRVSDDVVAEIRKDLIGRIADGGFGSVPMFVVPDVGPHEGLLEPSHIAEILTWLRLLAGRSTGQAVIERTLRGVWQPLRAEVTRLADAIEEQATASEQLIDLARTAAEPATDEIERALRSGAGAGGSVLTRWLAGASAAGPLAPLVERESGFLARRRYRASAAARRAALADLGDEVLTQVRELITAAGLDAEGRIREAWANAGLGGVELARRLTPSAAAREREARVDAALSQWASEIAEACRTVEPSRLEHGGALLDEAGRSALVQAAAVGLDGARRTVQALWGGAGEELVEIVHTQLIGQARTVVDAEGEAFSALVRDVLDDDAASALRLRASELKAYT